MLEKDLNKRLGCSKSTMFSIGGVGALKQHAFFEGLSWDLLLKLQIEPPIAVSQGTSGTDDYSSNFHEGFTSRPLSPSILEDSVCSPQSRSAAVSDTEEEDLLDFNFSVPFQCSTEQLAEFERALASKVVKVQRKAALRQKKAEEKAERAAAEEERNRQLQAELQRLALQREEEDRRLKERQRLAAERLEKLRALEQEQKVKAEYEAQVASHEASIEKVQKRLKALRKKLREITDLIAKRDAGAGLTPEQVEKLSKRQSVEDEIAECEEEEEAVAERRPVPPVFVLLNDEELVSRLMSKDDEELPCTGTVSIASFVLSAVVSAATEIKSPMSSNDSNTASKKKKKKQGNR